MKRRGKHHRQNGRKKYNPAWGGDDDNELDFEGKPDRRDYQGKHARDRWEDPFDDDDWDDDWDGTLDADWDDDEY